MKIFYHSKKTLLNHLFLTIFILFGTVLQINAQNIILLDKKLNENSGDAKYFQNLISNSEAYITVEGEKIETHGNGSYLILNCYTDDYNLLYTGNEYFKEVELLNLQINDLKELQTSLYINMLKGFQNLAFINVSITFDVCGQNSDTCLEKYIENLIHNEDEVPLLITYKLSVPN